MTDIATLTIKVDTTDVPRASRNLDSLAGSAGIVEGAVKKLASAWASWKVAEHVTEMAKLASRYEMLGVVMNQVGNNAGYTAVQMATFETSLEKTGISMIGSREALTKLAAANIDLNKSSELARAAQDAARIGNINSTEAFGRMVQGIQSGEVEILRTMGLNVQWEEGYKKLAQSMGKGAEQLTVQEKLNSRLSTVLEEGAKRAGVYEASMGMVGGQLLSMQRYAENLEVAMGSVFKPTLETVVRGLNGALADLMTYSEQNKQSLDQLGTSAGQAVDQIVNVGKAIGGIVSDSTETMDGLLFIRRTLQGIGGVAALVTDSITGIRVAIHDLAAVGLKELSGQTSSLARFVDKLPGTGNVSSAIEMAALQMRTGANIAWNGGNEIANRKLAVEKWMEGLDTINSPKAWVDKLGGRSSAPGGNGNGEKPVLTEYGREIQKLEEELRNLTMHTDEAYEAKLRLMDEGSGGDVGKAMGLKRQIDRIKEEKAQEDQWLQDGKERAKEENRLLAEQERQYEQRRKMLMDDGSRLTDQYLSPEARRAQDVEHLNHLLVAGGISAETYNRKMADLNSFSGPALESLSNSFDGAATALGNWAAGMDNASLRFKDMVKSMAADMARLYAQQGFRSLFGFIAGGVSKWLSGSSSSGASADDLDQLGVGLFDPGAASGGYRSGERPYLVGENGPEIFNPGRSGTITPNSALGGQVINSTVIVNVDSNGTAKTESQSGGTGPNVARLVEGVVLETIQKQMRPGGLLNKGSR